MKAEVKLGEQVYSAQLSAGHSIARTTSVTHGKGFDLSSIESESATYQAGEFIGAVSAGGSCNVSVLKINLHCCGTHTETVLHILSADDIAQLPTIDEIVPTGLQLALLLSVETSTDSDASRFNEDFTAHVADGDRLVTARNIVLALASARHHRPSDFSAWDGAEEKTLVLRIASDDPSQKTAPWSFSSEDSPPYFTADAIELLNQHRVKHLLVEFPSIDRMDDGGALRNHHLFWNLNRQSKSLNSAWPSKTITEMIEVPESLQDGIYLLSLQTPPVRSDAMLSQPVLFKLVD